MVDIKVLDPYKTIELFKDSYSLARFGDGEFFNIISKKKDISKLQTFDPLLRKKLINIFDKPLKKLLIGLPSHSSRGWVKQFESEFKQFVKDRLCRTQAVFVSSFFSRPSVIDYDTQEYFDKIKSIWIDRKIVLVNFNSDLAKHPAFKCSSTDFISIPRLNCFQEYNKIKAQCKPYLNKKKLFLISAGPTAKCLAYDLVELGEQCIDIGQIAFEYSLFMNEPMLEKYTSQESYRKKS